MALALQNVLLFLIDIKSLVHSSMNLLTKESLKITTLKFIPAKELLKMNLFLVANEIKENS